MIIDPKDIRHIIADEGMVLRRISTQEIYGKEVYLGKIVVDGQTVDDQASNFDEVAEPEPEPSPDPENNE